MNNGLNTTGWSNEKADPAEKDPMESGNKAGVESNEPSLKPALGIGTYILFMCLIVFLSKMLFISRYASLMPFWDQWEGEGLSLYKPYLDGTLGFRELLKPHNEHSIFSTRILQLVAFELNGNWDNLTLVFLNSFVNVAAVAVVVNLAVKPLEARWAKTLVFMLTVFFSLPIAWVNIVWGFQSQFYFVILYTSLSIWLSVGSPVLSKRWIAGFCLGILAFFNVSGGIMIFPVLFLFSAIRFWFHPEERRNSVIGCILCLVFFAAAFMLVPTTPGAHVSRAKSLSDFILAFGRILSWPVHVWHVHALLIWLPTAALGLHLWRKGFPKEDKATAVLALSIWVLFIEFLLAYARATEPTSSRFLDMIMVGVVTNASAAFILLQRMRSDRLKGMLTIAGSALLVWLGAWCAYSVKISLKDVTIWKNNGIKQKENVRAYMLTGDSSFLYVPRKSHVPYRAAAMETMLNIPEIRGILPEELGSTEAERAYCLGKTMLKGRLSTVLVPFRNAMLEHSLQLLVFFGVLYAIFFLLQLRVDGGWKRSSFRMV